MERLHNNGTTQSPSPTPNSMWKLCNVLLPMALLFYTMQSFYECSVMYMQKQTPGTDATLLAISCSCPLSRLFHFTGVVVQELAVTP